MGVKHWLESLDIDTHDAWTLFKLLDTDDSDSIDIEELVLGCLRLKGPARSMDMARLMYEHRWLMSRFLAIMSDFSDGRTLRPRSPTKSQNTSKCRGSDRANDARNSMSVLTGVI